MNRRAPMDSDKEKLLAEIELKVTTSCNWWMVNQQTLTSELARWIVDQVASIPFFAAPSPAQAVGGEPDYKAAWDGLQKRLTNHCRGDLHRDIPVDDLWNWIAGLEMDYLAPRSAPEAGEGEDDDTIDDGFNNAWSKTCLECGRKSMQVVRPGKVQCAYCG
jgi:hypothetical protein